MSYTERFTERNCLLGHIHPATFQAETNSGYVSLATYHRALTDFGVRNYSYYDLVLDYRLMLSYMLFDPVADLVRGSPRAYWWPKLNRLLAAYQDWECAKITI